MFQILNKISPILNSSNLQSMLGGKICPSLDMSNPQAYYQGMNQFRQQGYSTYDPTMQAQQAQPQQGWGQQPQQAQPQQGWGQQPQQVQQGWGQQNTQAQQGWGQQPQQAQPQQGWGQQSQGWGQQTQQPQQVPQGWGQQPQQIQTQQAPQAFTNKARKFGNGIVLKKGQKINLSNDNSIHEVDIGLGWDAMNGYDLDASAFMLGANGKVLGDEWFVFYGQPDSPDGALHHSGDSDGSGDGDDEIIHVNLDRVNPQVQKIVFIVTIDSALEHGYNFQNVRNAYMRVLNKKNNAEILRFNLSDYYANVTQMVVGELYRHNGVWKVNPVGDGVAADLAGLCARYGVNVAG